MKKAPVFYKILNVLEISRGAQPLGLGRLENGKVEEEDLEGKAGGDIGFGDEVFGFDCSLQTPCQNLRLKGVKGFKRVKGEGLTTRVC